MSYRGFLSFDIREPKWARSFFMDVQAGCPSQNAWFSSIWRAWPKFLAGCPQGYPAKNFLFGLNFRSWLVVPNEAPGLCGLTTSQLVLKMSSRKVTLAVFAELSCNFRVPRSSSLSPMEPCLSFRALTISPCASCTTYNPDNP